MPKALDMTTQISPAKPKVVANTDMKQAEGQDHSTKNTSWFSVMWGNKILRKYIFDAPTKEIKECENKLVEIFREYDNNRRPPGVALENKKWLSSEKKEELKSELGNFLLGADQKDIRSRISVGDLQLYDAESYLPVLSKVFLKIKVDQIHSVRLPRMCFKSGEVLNKILAPDIVIEKLKTLNVSIAEINIGDLDLIPQMSNLKFLILALPCFSNVFNEIKSGIESESVTHFRYSDGRDLKLDGIGEFPNLLIFDYSGVGCRAVSDLDARLIDFGKECKNKMPMIQRLKFRYHYSSRDEFRGDKLKEFEKHFKEEAGYDILLDESGYNGHDFFKID
ncbi:hypothetical protein QS306_05460 [Paraburkholderia bonniea]|uniref:hypothetical protein n=1 Tax=Paraburkholderia bonniea TaxID=2152891 RepID=UPI00257335AE|nr:hypothetical protein [Paraburkholderia bonniea]WJF91092.1 hypothetical protein QS306_05460 [Paraburkholderia bonniea]WJF94407.1 hypothetical protein QS308_05465 [Paraburkholderia bonniea]